MFSSSKLGMVLGQKRVNFVMVILKPILEVKKTRWGYQYTVTSHNFSQGENLKMMGRCS